MNNKEKKDYDTVTVTVTVAVTRKHTQTKIEVKQRKQVLKHISKQWKVTGSPTLPPILSVTLPSPSGRKRQLSKILSYTYFLEPPY